MSSNKSFLRNCMQPLKGKVKKYDFVGFDVETVNDVFYCGSLVWFDSKGVEQVFFTYDKSELAQKMLSKEFHRKYIVATNLSYDFASVFFETEHWDEFNTILFRSSRLMYADYRGNTNQTVRDGKTKRQNNLRVQFTDTLNYAPFPLSKLGKIINKPKLESPIQLFERKADHTLFCCDIKTKKHYSEKMYLEAYNIQDARISRDFMYFFQDGMNMLGGNVKMTSASSSMDLFRRRYLKEDIVKEQYMLKDYEINDFIFKGYYGGRTEAFSRGLIKNAYYYDINSLYPSVMVNAYPRPNSVKEVKSMNESIIFRYMGVTSCTVRAPENIEYPILPVKGKKLFFPKGTFKGVWNNVELAYAIENGYQVLDIERQVIYQESHYPFKEYVEDLYAKRLEFKKEGSAYEQVVKLNLNSLYGKFAQRRMQDYKVYSNENIPEDFYEQVVNSNDWDVDVVDNKTIFTREKVSKGVFIFPIYSSYTTSYARILMHKYMKQYGALYTDTDSIITYNKIPESNELGLMKLECEVNEGVIVKPKFYMINEKPKIKGLNKADHKDFETLMQNGEVLKTRFSTIKESVRRRIQPNKSIVVPKRMGLEDDKRLWDSTFNPEIEQRSQPQTVVMVEDEYVLECNIDEMMSIAKHKMQLQIEKENRQLVNDYLRNNPLLCKHFKGHLSDLKYCMIDAQEKGFNPDVIDWYSWSDDISVEEWYNNVLEGDVF